MEVSGITAVGNVATTTGIATTAPVNAPTSTGSALPVDRVEMSSDAMKAMESCSAAPVVCDNVVNECYTPYTRTGAVKQECNVTLEIHNQNDVNITQCMEETSGVLKDTFATVCSVGLSDLLLAWLILLFILLYLARCQSLLAL